MAQLSSDPYLFNRGRQQECLMLSSTELDAASTTMFEPRQLNCILSTRNGLESNS
jgi:hypothetical protein